MLQDTRELKTRLSDIYRNAGQYFQNHQKLMQQTVNGLSASEAYRIDKEYWSRMTEEDRDIGESLASDLIEVMSQVATAVRQSPLLDDADQREIVTYTKTMRAALYFRSYSYWGPEAIHDEGTVFGVSPAQQTEETIGIKSAHRLFRILGCRSNGRPAKRLLRNRFCPCSRQACNSVQKERYSLTF